jgi:hypothetical protein
MPVDERARHRLYLKLEEVLGSDEAGTLMAHLPPAGFAELATKDDLLLTRTELKTEMESLKQELKGDMASLKGEMASLKQELKGDMASLKAEMESLARRVIMWTSSMVLATGGLAFAAGRFA